MLDINTLPQSYIKQCDETHLTKEDPEALEALEALEGLEDLEALADLEDPEDPEDQELLKDPLQQYLLLQL
jgi:hypothetical protein